MALPLAGQPGHGIDAAARLNPHVRAFVWSDAGALDIGPKPQPQVSTLGPGARLLTSKGGDVDHLLGERQSGRVVAAVVSGWCAVLKGQPDVPRIILRLHEVAATHSPNSRAMRSIRRSMTKQAWGRPAPRYGLTQGVLV